MATISTNNLARAIYESSVGKDGVEVDIIAQKSVDLISKKHLMSKSKEILTLLEKIVDEKDEVVRAKISSRVKLDKKIIDEIEYFIKKKYKAKNTLLEFKINEALLGGIKIEIGDEIIDGTLKNRVKQLQDYLITN